MTIYDHIWPFFAIYMLIFHKTEIQTIIMRYLMSLNLNWYKSYDRICVFVKNRTKMEMETFAFCYIWVHEFWTNVDLDLLSTSKWPSEPQFCERWKYIWQKNGQKWSYNSYLRVTFILKQSLPKLNYWILSFGLIASCEK